MLLRNCSVVEEFLSRKPDDVFLFLFFRFFFKDLGNIFLSFKEIIWVIFGPVAFFVQVTKRPLAVWGFAPEVHVTASFASRESAGEGNRKRK